MNAQQIVDAVVGKPYCGFDAEHLNGNQPIPAKRACVYKTQHEPWARDAARKMRDKYGINLWVDGTVSTGWKILVHADDKDRAWRMFRNV